MTDIKQALIRFCVVVTLILATIFAGWLLYSLYLWLGAWLFVGLAVAVIWGLCICGGAAMFPPSGPKIVVHDNVLYRMYKHPYDPKCPCWTCARELNPNFIDDPANGQYKYWKDVPAKMVPAPSCPHCTH